MATTDKKFVPLVAVHPTELIKDEMRERGLKRNELAKRMGVQLPNLSRLLNKKETITCQTAARLETALGIEAEMWLNMQAAYDRDVISVSLRDAQEKEYASIENALAKILNVSLLLKSLAIDTYTFAQDRIKELYSAFHVANADELIALSIPTGRFKKSDKLASDNKNLNTWVLLAHIECVRKEVCDKYTEGNAVHAAADIAAMANGNEISEQAMADVLSGYGIAYGYVPKIEKAPVDAYSAITHDNKPCVITSHRRNNMDMLVFDVLHELKHIHTDLKPGETNISLNEERHNTDKREVAANKFAEDMLIPPSVWLKIMNAKSKSLNPNHIFNAVVKEAAKNGISASIASWRYKHDTGCYALKGYKSPCIK